MASQNTSSPTEAELHRNAVDLFFDSPDVFENALLRHPTQSGIWAEFISLIEVPDSFSLPEDEMTEDMCWQEIRNIHERYGEIGSRSGILERQKTIVPLPKFLDHDISDNAKAQLATIYEQNWGLAGTRLLRYYEVVEEMVIAHEHK